MLVQESVVTVLGCTWACKEAGQHSGSREGHGEWQQPGGSRAGPGGQGGRGGGTAGRARVVGLAVLTAARQGQGGRRAQPGGSSRVAEAGAGWQQQPGDSSSQVAAGAGWQHPGGRLAAEQPGGSRAAGWQQSSRVAAAWAKVAAARQGGSSREPGRVAQAWAGWHPGSQAAGQGGSSNTKEGTFGRTPRTPQHAPHPQA